MFERFIITVVALLRTAKRLPEILRGTVQPALPSYGERLRLVREEQAQRRAASRQSNSGADQ